MNRLRTLLPAALAVLCFPLGTAVAQVGTSYCFGNNCPCGNDDPNAGCANLGWDGVPTTGASLLATGSDGYACLDDTSLILTGVQSGQFGLVFLGGAAIDFPFGDGKRCVGGGSIGIHRYPLRSASIFGEITESSIVSQSQSFGMGAITGGVTRYFQGWYRDPGGPCGSQFNLSNAMAITFLPFSGPDSGSTQLAGEPLGEYPFFDYVTSFNEGEAIHVAIDPSLHPSLVGQTADLYVVADKSESDWGSDPTLVDVRGGPQSIDIVAGTTSANTFVVNSSAVLNGTSGTDIGVPYDIVIDADQDGQLDSDELIDGLDEGGGMYVVRDVTASGPYAVTEITYTGGTFLGQNTYYPTNVGSLGQLPLIVVSHGNGHNYQWYDHIGYHMASYGYIVMSHQNNTVPGIETASTTTLTNTDYFLGNLGTIAGGALQGHVDSSNITWIGHSRGGEGVTRAYDRIFDGDWNPVNYSIDDIRLISSIAPTDFLGKDRANPHDANYHLWTGSADADVNGSAGCDICQTFHLLERATSNRAGTTLQGAGHGAFHDGGGSLVASGPCLITRGETHQIMRGYFLPLVRYMTEGDAASKDFLWRQWESFKPIGAPLDACVVVNNEFKEGPDAKNHFIHDYQSGGGAVSSSGGPVTFTVTNLDEGDLDDNNSSFTWVPSDPMNGMTRMRSNEDTKGTVFTWNGPSHYELGLLQCERDLTDNGYLSFRACQGTQHPNTTAELGDLTFSVTLRDGNGTTSTISIGAYGGGIEEPYQRSGGWHNEFETIRVRLADFLRDGSGLDLSDVEAVRLEFGSGSDSAVGRLGLDDIEITLQ